MRIEIFNESPIDYTLFEKAKADLSALGLKLDIIPNPDPHILPDLRIIDLGSLNHIDSKTEVNKYEHSKFFDDVSCFFCPNCGVEFFVKTDYKYYYDFPDKYSLSDFDTRRQLSDIIWDLRRSISKDMYNKTQFKECPCCGGTLSYEHGYYLSLEPSKMSDYRITHESTMYGFDLKYEYGIDRMFCELERRRTHVEPQKLDDQVTVFVKSCDQAVVSTVPADRIDAIKNDPIKLKEYIQTIMRLENEIYSVASRLRTLYEARVKPTQALNLRPYRLKHGVLEAERVYKDACKKVAAYEAGEFPIKEPVRPVTPTLATPGLLNKKKVQAENDALMAKYQSALASYNNKMRVYEEQKVSMLAEAKEKVVQEMMALEAAQKQYEFAVSDGESGELVAVTFINDEISQAEELLKKLYQCRNELYGLDIIFEKYRNMVALSSFYEYLLTERCTTLVGNDGAYNIYEGELRANLIIEKLDEIKDTQYTMASTLRNINSNLDQLNTTMSTALESLQNIDKNVARIADNTDVIAHNSAVTAYYSKVNAQLTNALGFMVALK